MGSQLASASFYIDMGERCVRSFAQGVLAASGIGAMGTVTPASLGIALPSIPWQADLMFGVVNAGVSVLTSLSSLGVRGSDHETASFLAAPPVPALELKSWWRVKRHN